MIVACVFSLVMPGFMPGIHALKTPPRPKTWMAVSSPAMTAWTGHGLLTAWT